MQALVAFSDTKGPQLIEAPEPTPAAGDIVVKIAASAINPADLGTSKGVMRTPDMPRQMGLGWDVAGTVSAVGSAVHGFKIGDRVAALHADRVQPTRAHADYAVVAAAVAAHVPPRLELISAGSIPLNGLTAAQNVARLGQGAGRRLLVTGAAGAVGGYVVPLAVAAGWVVTGLARSSDEDFVREAGAGHFLSALDDARYAAVIDCAKLGEEVIERIVDQGRFISVNPLAVPKSVRGIEVSFDMVHADGAVLAKLLERSASGELAVRIAGSLPLTDGSAAYARAATSGQRGRWLLCP